MKLSNNLTIDNVYDSIISRHPGIWGYDYDQKAFIRRVLEEGLDVSIYAFPQYPGVLMQLLYEVMMFDDDFDINEFSADGTLNIEYLLLHHEDLSCRYRTLTRFSDVAREHILRRAPYYTKEKYDEINE